jgi:hypothetical protein
MARNAERRMLPWVLNTRESPGEFKPGILRAFLGDLGVAAPAKNQFRRTAPDWIT